MPERSYSDRLHDAIEHLDIRKVRMALEALPAPLIQRGSPSSSGAGRLPFSALFHARISDFQGQQCFESIENLLLQAQVTVAEDRYEGHPLFVGVVETAFQQVSQYATPAAALARVAEWLAHPAIAHQGEAWGTGCFQVWERWTQPAPAMTPDEVNALIARLNARALPHHGPSADLVKHLQHTLKRDNETLRGRVMDPRVETLARALPDLWVQHGMPMACFEALAQDDPRRSWAAPFQAHDRAQRTPGLTGDSPSQRRRLRS